MLLKKIDGYCKEKITKSLPKKSKSKEIHSTSLRRSPRKSLPSKNSNDEISFRKKKRKVPYLDSDDEEIPFKASDRGTHKLAELSS